MSEQRATKLNQVKHVETWQEEVIFSDGDAFFENLITAITSASKSISIEKYIFDPDVLGKKVLSALSAAADRGVKVRLLLDGAGCSEWDFKDAQKSRKKNFEIRFFHPMPWQRKYSRLWSYVNVNKMVRGFSLLNHRDHRKICLIDDDLAFIGSMNVSARHLKSLVHEAAWRDTSVRVRGEKIQVLHESFEEVWNFFNNYVLRYLQRKKMTSGLPLLMLNRTREERRIYNRSILHRVLSAHTRVWITNPYFLPTLRLRKVIRIAARKGVDMVMLFPSKSDFFGVKLAMESHYHFLLKSGVKLYEYQPSMIHAKILITDDRVMMGTSNLNSRSLLHDLEVDVEITHLDNIQLVTSQFSQDLLQAKRIEFAEWKKRSWVRRILEGVFFWFRLVL